MEVGLSYTKIVVKGMTKAEMVLKVVMAPTDPPNAFIEQYSKLLPDSDLLEFQKVLDMKGLRRNEQTQLVDLFRIEQSAGTHGNVFHESTLMILRSPDHESSHIRKLEKLIKKRL
uniref:Vps53 C-terminal domain-containing protein n=1 Tax=Timema douglasi TaxID=61478 RepID=A0A7R8VRK7_TIMDO|nr:unnamed protein product [Timema douglasi]